MHRRELLWLEVSLSFAEKIIEASLINTIVLFTVASRSTENSQFQLMRGLSCKPLIKDSGIIGCDGQFYH